MQLIITGFQYQRSSAKWVQDMKGNRAPRNAIAGGNGSFIVPDPPKINVDLQDVATGRAYTVDMYSNFKQMLYQGGYGKMTLNRAVKIISLYQSIQPFEAPYWDTWPSVDLKTALGWRS